MASEIPGQIFAALRKLGPSSPRQILDEIGGTEKKVGYHLRKLLAAKELKATGTSSDRVYAIPGQRRLTTSKAGAITVHRVTTGTVITLNEPLAARTADGRIVLIHAHGPGVPTILNAEFAAPLAELLLKKAA